MDNIFHTEEMIDIIKTIKLGMGEKKLSEPNSEDTKEDTKVDSICKSYNLKLGKLSMIHESDKDWIIDKETLFDYLDKSIKCEGEWGFNFRRFIYNNDKYNQWSRQFILENNISVRKNKYTSNLVIGAGLNWANWKRDKQFVCGSFHLIKQIYDMMKKRQK